MANQALAAALNFRDATRAQSKACISIEGLAGQGKTGLALLLAYHLADKDWQKVYGVDTENRSMDLYEGIRMSTGDKCTPFKKVDLLPMHGYRPSNYLLCKENAKKAGAKVFINDSISHMWTMKDGILSRVSELDRINSKVNKFTAWGTEEILNEKDAIYDVTRDSGIHIISTIRVKEKFDQIDGKIISRGEQQIFMPDFKFEPDLVLKMVSPGNDQGTAPVAEVLKSRYTVLTQGETYAFTEQLIQQIVDYLKEGADPAILQEQQRLDYIQGITEVCDTNTSKATMLPLLKEQLGVKDTKLADLPLDKVRTLLGMLIN